MASPSLSPEETFLSDPRFSQTFTLQPSPANGLTEPFTLKYADYGDPTSPKTLLLSGPLLSSRYHHTPKDRLAASLKIRIIDPDRPGVGGSSPCPAHLRLSLWRTLIPALLSHLNIPHVSIATHSGGVVFALDLILAHPELLTPEGEGGYLAIGTPWVLPSHSSSGLLAVVDMLPRGMVAWADRLAQVVGGTVAPAVGMAVGVSAGVLGKVAHLDHGDGGDEGGDEDYKFERRVWRKLMEKVFKEGVQGVSDDSVLLMQKAEGAKGWGDWGDYDQLVPRLMEKLRATGRRLSVDVFYAEKDRMIGDGGSKGPVWFDSCWEGEYGDVLEYRSRTVKGADHDGIWSLKFDAAREVYDKIAGKIVEATPPASSNSAVKGTI